MRVLSMPSNRFDEFCLELNVSPIWVLTCRLGVLVTVEQQDIVFLRGA
jgi:hypothetical protein